jgi:hypothetical protein
VVAALVAGDDRARAAANAREGVVSERDFKAQLEALKEPPAMTLEQALASEDPVTEIVRRIGRSGYELMTAPERVFWSVASFLDEVLNEGLESALGAGTRDMLPRVQEFARRYGSETLRELMDEVVDAQRDMDPDCLDTLTERFFEHEDLFVEGLVALASNNRAAFDLAPPKRPDGG